MPESKRKDLTENLCQSSERLSVILDNVLLAHQLIENPPFLHLKPCKIEELIEGEVEQLRPKAEKKGIKIYFKEPKEKIPFVKGDSEMLKRAFSRLIDNAIEYTDRGKIEISARKKRSGKKDFAEVLIKDTGIGLSEEEKKQLFTLFYRGKKATSLCPNGSGISLFISKALIEAHSGTVKAESRGRDKGSSFCVEIPLAFKKEKQD